MQLSCYKLSTMGAIIFLHPFKPVTKSELTCIDTSPAHMHNCELGDMSIGRLAECLLALKMREIRFVFVSSAAYTTVKQKPVPNLVKQILCNEYTYSGCCVSTPGFNPRLNQFKNEFLNRCRHGYFGHCIWNFLFLDFIKVLIWSKATLACCAMLTYYLFHAVHFGDFDG